MNRLLSLLAFGLVLVIPAKAQPTTVQEVFQAHIDAVGGAEAWMNVERSYSSGEVSMALPNGIVTIGLESWTIFPGWAYREMTERLSVPGMPPLDSKIYMTPDKGFMESFQGRMDLSEMPAEMANGMRRQAEYALEELGFLEDDSTEVVLLDQETIRGTLANVVEVRGDITTKRFYDAETGLLMAYEAPGQMGGLARSYVSDYRDIDGLKAAFKIDIDLGQMQQAVQMDKIEFNGDFGAEDIASKAAASDG